MVKTVAAEALGDEMDITLDGPLMDLGMDSRSAFAGGKRSKPRQQATPSLSFRLLRSRPEV